MAGCNRRRFPQFSFHGRYQRQGITHRPPLLHRPIRRRVNQRVLRRSQILKGVKPSGLESAHRATAIN
jgi:hypothetical protein